MCVTIGVIPSAYPAHTKVVSSRLPRNAASKNADRVGDLQFVVSDEPLEREIEGVLILPWKVFVDRLWSGELF